MPPRPRLLENHPGELYNSIVFDELMGEEIRFVQDNISCSKKGTIRGMHLQVCPYQEKLVTCLQGSLYDVAVCVDKKNKYFGKTFTQVLTSQDNKSFWIPAGYAHGFQALEDDTHIYYKCTNFYAPETERAFDPLDSFIAIKWPIPCTFVLSEKDSKNKAFDQTGVSYSC